MELEQKISDWVDAHERELLADIARLVAIRSTKGEPTDDAPFGEGPKKALDEALALCREYGFKTESFGGAVGTADLNDLPTNLDILAHLDVVDEGDGWDTDPYTCVEKDGCLFGRGTDDDKGPVVMALYALRCMRELNLPLRANARLILGTNEEDGSLDLPYYYDDHAPAPNTFTPDSGFPVYNVEKGSYRPVISVDWPARKTKPRVSEFEGGFRLNVIPSDASATVTGMTAAMANRLGGPLAEQCGVTLTVTKLPEGVRLQVHGTQTHAAYPQAGNNGLTALLYILAGLPLGDCPSSSAIRRLAAMFPHGDYLGKACGMAQSDDISGELTLAFTMLTLTETGLTAKLDCRVPLCANYANCRFPIEERFRRIGFSVDGGMQRAHHTPADGEFVKTLLACYESFTGKKGECLYTGGGTYVHDIEGGVAFGAGMPGFDSHLHGANERISIADSLCAVKIFALSVARLCGGE
ncbi:MAG: Sapep family Mn(2+)-dependent dipeptidase [Oscillospiraceae bacterium]